MDIRNQKFLVIDDHFLIRQMVSSVLQDAGAVEIDTAADGAVALQKIQQANSEGKPYSTVFLDWSMPNMNGYELLTACRGDRACDDMAIVMLTAESEDANLMKAMAAGATAYINKPSTPAVIVEKLQDLAAWRGRRNAGMDATVP